MEKIHILQLGKKNWNEIYELTPEIHLDYVDSFAKPPEKPYDICFLDRQPMDKEISLLHREIKAYTLFFTEKIEGNGTKISDGTKWLCQCKKAKRILSGEVQQFLNKEAKYFYSKPYGEKLNPKDFTIAHGFSGKIRWNGNCCVVLEGDFGNSSKQIAFWRYNVPLFRGQSIDFWLEYFKTVNVSITMTITSYAIGSISQVLNQWEFTESDLGNVIQIQGGTVDGWLFISLNAKGQGGLQIIALHDRYSRGKHGYFLPGGERYVTSGREEVFCYFDPGDLKPPLNVYFSGYKRAQGFEGYYMMKGMGSPFLLLSEPRLEGGGFYMGTPEYENLFADIITNHMTEHEVGTLRLTGFRQQVSGSRLPNRTYTSQRIRLSMNHLDSLVSCKSSKQSGQSARDFLRISNIFFSNISLPFSDFSVLTWCIHKYSACSPHISHFPALIRLIIVCLLSYFL